MTDWGKIRKDFPITENIIYFQSAAMSPMPQQVFNTITENYRKVLEYGDIYWDKDMENYALMCKDVAGILNTETENITFVQNTSTAMSLMALSFKKNTSTPFNMVSMMDEFPSSTIGFEYQGIEMRYVEPKNARYPIESILNKTDDKTLGVITSYVQYATGFRQDLKNLGREVRNRKILFIVNATQAFPFYPLDMKAMNIDVLTASMHKWGFTGHIGTVFFTSASFRKKYPNPVAGWLSVKPEGKNIFHTAKNTPFSLYDSAQRYDLGTHNLQPNLAFQTSLDYLKNIGFENIRVRILELTDYLIQGLESLGADIISPVAGEKERSAIIAFSLGSRNKSCIKNLEENNIFVSFRDGNIRVSLNIFNNFEDIDSLVNSIKIYLDSPGK